MTVLIMCHCTRPLAVKLLCYGQRLLSAGLRARYPVEGIKKDVWSGLLSSALLVYNFYVLCGGVRVIPNNVL